jgi:hypothetical protein
MIEKGLLRNESDFTLWIQDHTGKGIDWYYDEPDTYPCVIVWREYDISNSMSYGSGIDSEFVYLSDFDDE